MASAQALLLNPHTITRLLKGLSVTLRVSLISVALSILFGLVFGWTMTKKSPVIKILSKIYLEFMRLMPQLVLLFIVYFGMARALGVHISGFNAAIIVFTLWGTAEMGDLVRGAISSIPKHQYEAAQSIGLTRLQVMGYVVLPQALRRLIPQAMNLVTRMIKTTSLIALIGVVEVIKTGQQIVEAVRLEFASAALWIYLVILILYFLVCYPLSKWAGHLEKKWKEA
ncbi:MULTISPECIES: amino acid ABC transporter permease [Aedoeadaptatus]|uniref:Amino acid ABC transporter permease n=1 Tax=Aedoeadaptatus acetigenes TaxID=2981723 RepID=A0ABV1J4W9_9FIRM|nr:MULTISPECIES: amino acid ABC transporter permease [Peptoniphilaceae]MBS6525935.1 amino acid ABC transporter permease [Peptoniphilaceae bacterium]MCU6786878.1 amino acid ABC transporter permease [Aedoeadaptatus acetigenes]